MGKYYGIFSENIVRILKLQKCTGVQLKIGVALNLIVFSRTIRVGYRKKFLKNVCRSLSKNLKV